MKKYIDPITLKLQVDNYFTQVTEKGEFTVNGVTYVEDRPTLSGLSIFLGFTTSSWINNYVEDPEYEEAVGYAKLRIENQYEKKLQDGVANAKIGLRRMNKDWEDATTVQHGFTFADMVKRASEGNKSL